MVKKIFKIIAYGIFSLAALIVLLIVLAALLISSPPGERFLKNMLQPRLEQILGCKVRIGGIDLKILTRARLENVSISREIPGMGDIPLLEFKRAEARYALTGLLKKRFTVHSVRLDGVYLNLDADSTGIVNLPRFKVKKKEPSAPGPIEFVLGKVSLEKSTFHYRNSDIRMDLSVGGAQCEIDFTSLQEFIFRISADSVRYGYGNGTLSGTMLAGNGAWNADGLTVEKAFLNMPEAVLAVENFVFRNAGNDRFGGRVTFSGNPESISTFARGLFSPSIPMISGEVSLRIDLSQPSGNLRMQCHLASPRLRIADIPAANPLNAENVSAVVHWSGDAVTLDSMHVETLGGTLKGSGTLALREGEMRDFNVRFQRLDSGQIARFLGIHAKEYSGSFSGWCSASGKIESIETMNAALVVEVNKAFFHSKPIPDLAAHSVLDKGVLNARISGAHSMITITADVMKSALAGKFTADINQLSDFSPIPGMDDLRGKIHVSGILGGTPSRPEVSASVAGDSIRYRNFPLDSLKGGVEYRNNAVSFSNVRLAGRISSLATLKPPLHVDSLSGTVSYAIEMDGPLTGPSGEIVIEAENPSYHGISFNTARITALVRGDSILVRQANLARDSLRIEGAGAFDYRAMEGAAGVDVKGGGHDENPPGRLSVSFGSLKSKMLDARFHGESISAELLKYFAPEASEARGLLFFSGAVNGSFSRPQAEIDFFFRQPGFRSAYLDSMRGEVLLRNGIVSLESLRLYREKFISSARGRLDLTETPESYTITPQNLVRFTASGDSLRLSWLEGLAPGVKGVDGLASFELILDGPVGGLSPKGKISVENFSLNPGGGSPPIRDADISAAVEGDTVILGVKNGTVLQQPFSLDARLRYTPPNYGGDINLFVEGQRALNLSGTIGEDRIQAVAYADSLNLSVLRAFLPNLEGIAGDMNAELKITGTFKNPQTNGFLNIRNLSFNPPGIDLPLRNGVAKISISPNMVMVDTLRVQSRGGVISVSGSIENIMNGAATGQLKAEVQKILLQRKNEFNVLVNNAQFTFSKTGSDDYLLKGRIGLGETRFVDNITVEDIIRRITAPRKPGEPPPAFFRQTRLDVALDGGEKIYIDNNLADIRLRSELQVVGTLAGPVILGNVTAVEGKIYYLDREFKIIEGIVEFNDRRQMNPRLDIVAEATVAGLQAFGEEKHTITLSLTGTMQKPDFTLASDPPLDRPNIISLLTLGVTREQAGIGAAQSDTTVALEDVLKQRAETLASRQIAGYLGRQIEGLLGLEEVTIEGNLFDFSDKTRRPRVTASQQLTDDIQLTYTTSFSDLNSMGFRILYDVTNKISLQGETGRQGRTGFDILYRFRFR